MNKKIYVKFLGTNGSGKTTMVRAISKAVSGVQCDDWINKEVKPIIAYSICNCSNISALGTWSKNNKINGMDTMRGDEYKIQQKLKSGKEKLQFAFYNKILDNKLDCVESNIILEDACVQSSVRITDALSSKFDLYIFHMDYPLDTCVYNYEIKRGSKINVEKGTIDNIKRKWDEAIKIFNSINIKNKFKLSGTIEDNTKIVMDILKLTPCNCMKNKNIRSRSLFE